MDDDGPTSTELGGSRDLPPYRAILVVDARGYGDATSVQQLRVNAEVQDVLAAAFLRAGLGEAWRSRRFSAHEGDGYVVGALPEKLPHLVHPLLQELQAELAERDRRRYARDARLRLRASVHVGPVPDRGAYGDGVGRPMTETHRLLDSDEVRGLLESTEEEVTFLAAIVSERAYVDAVEGGYTALHPGQFIPITARSKRFEERAYLHVPCPSGPLLRRAFQSPADAAAPPEERPGPGSPGAAGNTATIIGETKFRDLQIGDRNEWRDRRR